MTETVDASTPQRALAAATDALLVTAIATAALLVACFVSGLGAGASLAASDDVLAQPPAETVATVDDGLRSASWAGPVEHGIATIWPAIEAPLLAGISLGLVHPLAGEAAYWLTWLSVLSGSGWRLYRAGGDGR